MKKKYIYKSRKVTVIHKRMLSGMIFTAVNDESIHVAVFGLLETFSSSLKLPNFFAIRAPYNGCHLTDFFTIQTDFIIFYIYLSELGTKEYQFQFSLCSVIT